MGSVLGYGDPGPSNKTFARARVRGIYYLDIPYFEVPRGSRSGGSLRRVLDGSRKAQATVSMDMGPR